MNAREKRTHQNYQLSLIRFSCGFFLLFVFKSQIYFEQTHRNLFGLKIIDRTTFKECEKRHTICSCRKSRFPSLLAIYFEQKKNTSWIRRMCSNNFGAKQPHACQRTHIHKKGRRKKHCDARNTNELHLNAQCCELTSSALEINKSIIGKSKTKASVSDSSQREGERERAR